MAKIISEEDFQGYTPYSSGSNGRLDGNFEELLQYIEWVMNYREIDERRKGERFKCAITTLLDRYGIRVSTQYLQQFCKNRKQKSMQVIHLLNLSDYKTEPVKRKHLSYWKVCGRSTLTDIYDMLIPLADWQKKQERIAEFKEECIQKGNEGVMAMAKLFN